MDVNENDFLPPTYEDVVRENYGFLVYQKLMRLTRITMTIVNFTLCGIIGFVLFLIQYSKLMKTHRKYVWEHCKASISNYPVLTMGNSFMVLSIFPLLLTFWSIVLYRKIRFREYTWITACQKTMEELCPFISRLGALFVFYELFKLSFGIPPPYFLNNANLKEWYCGTGKGNNTVSQLIMIHHASLPSFRFVTYSFSSLFLYLYAKYSDVVPKVYLTQHCIAMVSSFFSYYLILKSLEPTENYYVSSFVGSLFGFFQGVVAFKNVYRGITYFWTGLSDRDLESFINEMPQPQRRERSLSFPPTPAARLN